MRVLLELLTDEVPTQRAQLAGPDAQLKRLVDSGDFIWDQELKSAFPKDKYWFLWAQPMVS